MCSIVMAGTRTKGWSNLLVAAGLILSAACVSPEIDDDTVPAFSTDTVMGVIQESGTLVVGIDPDLGPPWASHDCPGENKRKAERSVVCLAPDPEGFLADFAREVAASLGVEAEFHSVPGDELLSSMEPEASEYDLAFPARPVTESLVREQTFANPYYVAHQRLLVSDDSGIDSVDEVGAQEVCVYTHPGTGVALDGLNSGLDSLPLFEPSCDEPMKDGTTDVATAPDIYLIQWKLHLDECASRRCRRLPSFSIVGDQLTTEGFAPLVETAATGMADWVSAVLGEAKNEGRYMDWYDEWIGPYLEDPLGEPPTMTIEEAAALFPTDPG